VPLEPRAAVAEFDQDGKLTVWTATQNPMRVKQELQEALELPPEKVRVIVPDFGGGFGGKHTGECAVEAARIAREAKKPVSLRWSRREEFQWASFRPAALILCEAGLDAKNTLDSWHYVNVNSGGSGLSSPYRCANKQQDYVESSDPPLRHGSYRALAATANHFARESFVDELAHSLGEDPLAFRLRHLEDQRILNVLNAAARKFDWSRRNEEKNWGRGVGLACGTEKNSVVAACVEIDIHPQTRQIRVLEVCQAYECGKIMNPSGLMAQVQGAILQGLGPALWEAIEFKEGVVTNGRLSDYRVPRFADVPRLDIELLDRPDLPSVGAGETPIIAIAPAIANAVFHATGQRVRTMPIRLA
jgi:isoquinoline 1-oxidoreductase subunit beta